MKNLYSLCLVMLISTPCAAFTLCIEDVDLPPLQLAQGDSANSGVMPLRIHLAAQRVDESVELSHIAWRRCIEQVRSGKTDAMAAVIWTPERDKWGAFPKLAGQPDGPPDASRQVWREIYPIFVPLQSQLSYDGNVFSGIQHGIGAPPGYVVWDRLQKAGVLSKLVLQPEAGLRLVALNRLDGYTVDRTIGEYLLKQMGLRDQVRLLPTNYQESDAYLVFSNQFRQQNPELTESVWNALRQVRIEQEQARSRD